MVMGLLTFNQDSDKKIREAIKTLERELRDESVSRKTAERKIVQLYDTIDALCSRMTFLEKKLEDYLDHCPHCKHTKNNNNNNNNPDSDPSSLSSVDSSKSISTDPASLSPSISSSSVSPPTTPTFLPMQTISSLSSLTPISPPSPLRVSVSHPRIQDPFGPHSPIINNTRHRFSAGLVPLQTPSSPSSSSIPSSPLASSLSASSALSPASNPTPPSPSSFGPLSPSSSPPFNPNINSPSSAAPPSLSLSPSSPSSTLSPSSPISSINSPRNFPHGGASILRAYSASNLSMHLQSNNDRGESPNGKLKQNGKEKDKKDKKEKDKDKEEEEAVTKETSRKTRIFSRKAIVSMLSPPTSPLQEPSPKSSRKASPSRKDRDDSEKDKDKDRMEKSKSFQLVRSSSVLRLKSIQSFPLKSSLKIEPSHPMSVFNNMGVSDETCVKVIKDITSFLKNYVHMPPSDLFQQKAWSEQAILLKEAIQAGTLPDFSFKYQHDPHSVAQFLYEILASSDKGILSKVGQGLVDSVEIDLENYPGLKFYRLSLLHSLVFLLEEDPHFALFYTLDLLRSFVKIRPEAYNFFGQKFGPVCLKDFPERSPNAFATLLVNFSAILEVREDINFVVKDGRQTVHAASLDRLFEKLLDPYYRDSVFVDTFFLTFDYFINAEEMLKKFTSYYWLAATGFPQNWKTQLSIRVLAVIKMWIMQHEEMFQKDENFLTLLRSFVDSVTTPYQSELSFFRYFASLVYKYAENDQDGELQNEDGDHVDNANGNVLSELSNDSELYVSKNSSGSFTDNPISTSDERSSSALTMYDLDDEFSKSDTPTTLSPIELKSDTPPGFSPVAESEFTKTENPIIRSASESNAPQQQQQQQPTSQHKGGSPLNRSSSSNNIYLTKDGKLGTITRVFNKSNKSPSSSNLFAAYANPRATSPTPSESSADDSDNTRHRGTTISVSPPSPTPMNGNEKDKEKEAKKTGLLTAHRKSRSRGNSDDANLLKLMASSDIPKLLSQGQFNPVCSIDPAIVAMHMAVIDQSFLRMIPYTEWLHKSFVSQDLSPNFHNMVAKFNDWGRWACTEILRREKLVDRVNVVTYFVDIIKHSVAINNFNAAAALIGGLSHSSVSRLRPTWEKVPAKVMQDFTKMTTLFEMVKNYKNYREAVKTCKPPVIPYLALIPKDLIAIEEGNATTLENGLINFHKLRLLAKLVKYVAQIQQPLYVHPNNTHEPALNEYLRNKLGGKEGLLAEREMMNLSLILQPFASTSKGV